MKKIIYSCLILISLFVVNQSKANIVAFVPGDFLDATLGPNTISYNIMGQSLDLSHWDFFGNGFQIDGNNNVVGLVDPTLNVQDNLLKKLNFGDIIDGTSAYMSPGVPPTATAYHCESNFSSPFGYCMPDFTNAYFGFKVIVGANTYYGWMSVFRVSSDVVVIDEYAYDNTPNTPIPAGVNATPVTNITVTGFGGATTITSNGATLQMNAAVLPTNATNQNVTWSVVNGTGFATISGTGLLTPVGNGTVTVVATAQDGSGVVGTLVITISNQIVLTQSISVTGFGGVTTIVVPNGALQMVANFTPSFTSNQVVNWTVTAGSGFATIDPVTGILTAVANGTVTVTATATDGTGIAGSVIISISNQPPTLANSMTVNGVGGVSTITTNLGTLQMVRTILPTYTTNQAVTWSIANGTGSATISPTGLVAALTNGTVIVTATAQDGSGVSGSATITISNQIIFVTNIVVTSVNGLSSINVNGGTLQLSASVSPIDASNLNVIWSVINGTGSGTISPTGLFTATGNGNVVARATAADGSGVFGTFNISIINQIVPALVNTITVTSLTNTCVLGNTLQMYTVIAPANATVQNVAWSVINGTGSATINSSGLLTGTGVGVVTVLASALDTSGKIGSKQITIINAGNVGVDDIDLSQINVYPNPFNNQIQIDNLGVATVQYSMMNSLGQIIATGELSKSKNIISLEKATAGIYILQIGNQSQNLQSYKLVKAN